MIKELHCLLLLLSSMIMVPIKDTIKLTQPIENEIKQTSKIINKRILLLYAGDNHAQFTQMTSMIKKKMQLYAYDITKDEIPDAQDYDLILLGDHTTQDQPSQAMIDFLSWYDMQNKQVSAYWLYQDETSRYEETIAQLINNGHYLLGLGIQEKQAMNQETINALINGWLTSVYSPVNVHKKFL